MREWSASLLAPSAGSLPLLVCDMGRDPMMSGPWPRSGPAVGQVLQRSERLAAAKGEQGLSPRRPPRQNGVSDRAPAVTAPRRKPWSKHLAAWNPFTLSLRMFWSFQTTHQPQLPLHRQPHHRPTQTTQGFSAAQQCLQQRFPALQGSGAVLHGRKLSLRLRQPERWWKVVRYRHQDRKAAASVRTAPRRRSVLSLGETSVRALSQPRPS